MANRKKGERLATYEPMQHIEVSTATLIQWSRNSPHTKMPRELRKALAWAVGRAAEWRGLLVGNPDPKPLQEFDYTVRLARRALALIRK